MVALFLHRLLFHFQGRDLIKKCKKIIKIRNIFSAISWFGSVAAVAAGIRVSFVRMMALTRTMGSNEKNANFSINFVYWFGHHCLYVLKSYVLCYFVGCDICFEEQTCCSLFPHIRHRHSHTPTYICWSWASGCDAWKWHRIDEPKNVTSLK